MVLLICVAVLIAVGVFLLYLWEVTEEQWTRGERCPICGKRVEHCPGHEGIRD